MTAILLLSAVDMVTVLPDFAQWEVSPEQGKCINENYTITLFFFYLLNLFLSLSLFLLNWFQGLNILKFYIIKCYVNVKATQICI